MNESCSKAAGATQECISKAVEVKCFQQNSQRIVKGLVSLKTSPWLKKNHQKVLMDLHCYIIKRSIVNTDED